MAAHPRIILRDANRLLADMAQMEERDAEGRSARFPAGWFILPGALLGALLWAAVFAQALPQAALDAQALPECGAPC